MKQSDTHELYMDIASRVAQESKATRLKVGAVLVRPSTNSIVSYGFNGTPNNYHTNVCEDENNNTKPIVIHAEMNAILKAASNGISTQSCFLYITHAPCLHCASAIKQAGISSVFYRESYRDTSGVDELSRMGVCVNRL